MVTQRSGPQGKPGEKWLRDLTPGNATVWYETVFAFLAQHVLGEKWRRPELL